MYQRKGAQKMTDGLNDPLYSGHTFAVTGLTADQMEAWHLLLANGGPDWAASLERERDEARATKDMHKERAEEAAGGVAAILGRWPGDETDAEIAAALAERDQWQCRVCNTVIGRQRMCHPCLELAEKCFGQEDA